jgi:hypothetical protein
MHLLPEKYFRIASDASGRGYDMVLAADAFVLSYRPSSLLINSASGGALPAAMANNADPSSAS